MLYTPGEICKKLDGINPRAIADMAQRGLVIPVKEASGAGTSRLYDKAGVFKIMVIAALRGSFPIKTQSQMLKNIIENIGDADSITVCEVSESAFFTTSGAVTGMTNNFRERISSTVLARNPKAYMEYTVYVGFIREFVDKNF